jgi:KaiC/GvpD/RAD55 family RecA-like ATPase
MSDVHPDGFNGWPQDHKNQYFAEQTKIYRDGKKSRGSNQPIPFMPAYHTGLKSLSGAELLSQKFPPPETILSPWLPEKGLAMIFADRGVGKTWVALNIAYAVASGGEFLGWQAHRPRRVVYIDGEMPASALRDRFASIVNMSILEAAPEACSFVAADLQPDGLPDLADPTAQRFYATAINEADLVIVDNLSTVARGLRENEADAWQPVQQWALSLRAAGKSVLFVHHAGKSGGQRGSSRKEDVLDTVISLQRPLDYDASQGARFEIHFSKNRGFFGDSAKAFEARLSDGIWRTGEIVYDDSDDAILKLKKQGKSVREIAGRTGLSKSSVDRRLKGGA